MNEGADMRRRREALGLTRTQFCEIGHLARGTLVHVENGHLPVSESFRELWEATFAKASAQRGSP